jgi:uncharacterized membrane protein YdbT with pleckstrin-like domain
MSYVEDHLLPGERVTYRARLHKLAYVLPVLTAIVLITGGFFALSATRTTIGLVAFVAALVPLIAAYITYTSSEFAVTNKRVIIKVGFIQRKTLETMLGKVEGIGVDQGILGRMLDYGTITITGTGGTKEPFRNIAAPLEFRRQVQAQISPGDEDAAIGTGSSAAREERECPYCAELILKRAKVCKHCGREVEPQ